jgi:hypothetical protein
MLMAEITGKARHRAKRRELTSDQEAAAVGALRELTPGRTDLLAEVAGIFEDMSEGRHDEPPAPVLRACAARPESTSRRVGFHNSATGLDLGFYAARSYSLMRPPRTGRRLIRSVARSATGWSGRGGWSWRPR